MILRAVKSSLCSGLASELPFFLPNPSFVTDVLTIFLLDMYHPIGLYLIISMSSLKCN